MEIASLWFDIDAPAIVPPTVTREQVLPLDSLPWENFERLCFRLAHRSGDVEDARIYGVPGQSQEGIDLYVRRASGDYETWQCKRYKAVATTDIEKAVTKFLEGGWAGRTKLFRLAVAPSLNATKLCNEIEKQRARCQAKNITFVSLDQDQLSIMLKDHPDLVDDFFGRPWVEAFNGPEASSRLSGRKLNREQKIKARLFIKDLYTTYSRIVDSGIPAAAQKLRGAVQPVPIFERYVEPDIELVEYNLMQRKEPADHGKSETHDRWHDQPITGFYSHEIRTKIAMFAGLVTDSPILLLGGAGFGKSAALRIVAHSLLSNSDRFPSLAKSWGQRLPLLLPFGFLTSHFAKNESPTVEVALRSWLKELGARNDVLELLEEMLEDERLLLLVDGLDEWQNQEAAVAAFTALTLYIHSRRLPLVATGRPYGVEKLNTFATGWKQAKLLPLTADQQKGFATYWFRHFHMAEAPGEALDAISLEQAVSRAATEFANELSQDPKMSELSGVPLMLSVMIYLRLTGRVLPHSRLSAIEEMIKALLEDQPQRRTQAALQCVDQSASRSRYVRYGIEYLAYCIHQESNSIDMPNERATQLLNTYFRNKFELSVSEAEMWAACVLGLGQHEFGILVAPQDNHVGFLHRIFQEYLVSRHLSRLSLDQVKSYCANTGCRSPWHEITLTLMHLIERPDEVDGLIDELRKPVADCLEEPLQQILLTRVAVAEINCSRKKALELLSQVYDWIEYGQWMPLRRALVQEIAAGLESEQVAASLATRAARWFPGRVNWLYNIPTYAAEQPTDETVSDLLLALHNCNSQYEYRNIAKALASFAEKSPELADELLRIIRGPAEPELLGAALHALATGWPTHTALLSLLQEASVAPVKGIRYVAILARFNRGERSEEVRNALVDFCREWLWPWDEDIMGALVTGWPRNPQLMNGALETMRGFHSPKSWWYDNAIAYLLRGCPGDDDVAQMLARELAKEKDHYPKLDINKVYEALLAGFANHPLLVPAAEAWLDRNAEKHHSPLDVAVIAKLGGTPKCRKALLDWLRRGRLWPAWIISTLLEMSSGDDTEVQAVLADYIQDEARRAEVVRWLPAIIREPKELGDMLRNILRDAHVSLSCSALEILFEKEGSDTQDLWPLVEARLKNDESGQYWRHGCGTILKIWHEHPLIRRLAKSTIYDEHMSIEVLYRVYGSDPEIRPLLDCTMHVLHKDLRVEFARAIEPLAQRGVPAAVTIAAGFRNELNGEARTVAARAYARARIRQGGEIQDLIKSLSADLTAF